MPKYIPGIVIKPHLDANIFDNLSHFISLKGCLTYAKKVPIEDISQPEDFGRELENKFAFYPISLHLIFIKFSKLGKKSATDC